jgi:hypothetical protein
MKIQTVFKTCTIRQIGQMQSYLCCHASQPTVASELSRCIWLPQLAEAQILLEKFIRVAHHLPYITHVPSIPLVLQQVYSDMTLQRQIQSGPIILLLSIFAVATYSWVDSDCIHGLFATSAEANSQAPLWIKAAEEILDIANRSSKVSIEKVQGIILVGFVVAHLEGLHRHRALFATSMVLARDLGLHRIDHPSNTDLVQTTQAEIGRRIWWHLCASDWYVLRVFKAQNRTTDNS